MITFKQYLLLIEAREDQIANSQGHKLLTIYNQKEHDHKFTDALDLVKFISNQTNPKYIQWTINQYLKDPNFHLQQLPEIKQLLTQYEPLANRKKIQPINNLNIETLKQTLKQAAGGLTQHQFDPFALRFYEAMINSVNNGNGTFKHQSGNLCVYVPNNHKGAADLRRAHPDVVKLCTTYLDDDRYYNNYVNSGTQYYILTSNTMYLFFIQTIEHSIQPSEFADYKNNHGINTKQILDQHPLVRKIISSDALKCPDFSIPFKLLDIKLNDKSIQFIANKILLADKNNTFKSIKFRDIPAKFLNKELVDLVYNKLSEKSQKSLIRNLPEDVRNSLSPDIQIPTIPNTINITNMFNEIRHGQLISTRRDFIEYCIEAHRYIDDIIEDLDWTEIPDNTGIDALFINIPEQIVTDNFPTFDDMEDAKQAIKDSQLSNFALFDAIYNDESNVSTYMFSEQDNQRINFIELQNATDYLTWREYDVPGDEEQEPEDND